MHAQYHWFPYSACWFTGNFRNSWCPRAVRLGWFCTTHHCQQWRHHLEVQRAELHVRAVARLTGRISSHALGKQKYPGLAGGQPVTPWTTVFVWLVRQKKKKKRGTTNILFACFFFRDKFSLHSWLRSQIQAVKLLQISQQNLWVLWRGPLLSPLDSIPYLSNLHLGMANYTIPSSDLWPEMQPASPCHLAGAMLPMQQRCIQPPCASCPVWSYRTKVFVVVMQEKGYRVHFVQICQKSIFKGIF